MRIAFFRCFTPLLAAIALTAGAAGAQEAGERPWLVSLNVNHGSFSTGDIDADGTQTLSYAQVAYEAERWGVAAAGSYAATSYDTEASERRFEASAFRDTTLSGYYRFAKGGLAARAGLDVTLPTGKSAFESSELARVMTDDVREDLLLAHTYGGGLNVNPSLALTYKTGPVIWGAGVKYLFVGEYNPTTDADGDDFDPGDVLTGILSALVDGGRAGKLLLTATYTRAGADRQGGREVFREGDSLALEARGIRQWTEAWRSTIGLILGIQEKNERLGDGDVLRSETGNANGDSLEILTTNVYRLASRVSLTGILGYKKVEANGYSDGDALHDAGRSVLYLEPGGAYYLRDDLYVMFRLRYTRVSDKKDAFSPKDAAYDVINADAGVVYSF